VLLACPGLVYRRDRIDRLSVGEPHQLDLWRIASRPLEAADLREMASLVVEALLPGAGYRALPAEHPYTVDGLELEVRQDGRWVEIAECGLASPVVLGQAGLSPARSGGLAMGIGLDRVLMLRKGVDDIRLLRSPDPRVAAQMRDLEPYRLVSSMPPIRRDLSIAVTGEVDAESLGDRVREALGPRATSVESVEVLSVTPGEDLPETARARIGISPGQRNVLVRVVLRDLESTLTSEEANALRDRIYGALHQGDAYQWT
jgi:phenylalanyl-tRNA synthetase alpha chain